MASVMSARSLVKGHGPLAVGRKCKYPLHHSAYTSNIEMARELLVLDKDKSEMVQDKNPDLDNGTVLHSCARGGTEESHKMAQLLLQYIPSDSVHKIVNQADTCGKSSLYYAVRASQPRLVEVLLNTGLIDSNESGLAHLAVQRKASAVLKHLIDYGFPASDLDEKGQTPLHLCVQQSESKEIEECLRVLVQKYTSDEINLVRKDGRTAIHLAAELCSPLILEILLEHKGLNLICEVSNSQKNALHLVVESYKNKISVECLRMLMMAGTTQIKSQTDLFCDTFAAAETPLDLALENRATKIIETVVTILPDRKKWLIEYTIQCWMIRRNYLSKLYKLTPAALPALMTQCLTLSGDGTDVHADLGAIRGYAPTTSTDPVPCAYIETRYLIKVLDHPNKKTQKEILLHPLVQIFLHGKQRTLNNLIVASILIQAIWLILYSTIVRRKYDTYDNSSCQTNVTNSILSDDCVLESPSSIGFVSIFLVLTIFINLKEVAQLMSDGLWRYWRDNLNRLQILSFVFAMVVGFVGLFVDRPGLLFLVLAAFGFLMGCIVFLKGFVSFEWCGIYISAVVHVIPRTARLVLIFLPILIGFRQYLKILLPALKNQLEGSLKGVTKVLVVMTGEYDYNGVFENNQPNEFFDVSGTVGFIVFVIIGIALFNTLVALAVDDVSKLTKDANFRMAETRLKQIYHWEMFFAKIQRLCCCCSCCSCNLSSYLLLDLGNWRKGPDQIVILTTEEFISLLRDSETDSIKMVDLMLE